MCDETLYAAQLRALHWQGYDCFFHPFNRQTSIGDMAQTVLAHDKQPLVLVGLSMGGIVALETYTQAPARIEGMILLNTTPKEDSLGKARYQQIENIRTHGMAQLFQEFFLPAYLAEENRTAELETSILQMAEKLGADVFERQSIALLSRQSYESILTEINCPTLLIAGALDRLCPPQLHIDMAGKIADASLTIIEKCGHFSTLEKADKVTERILRFLRYKKRYS